MKILITRIWDIFDKKFKIRLIILFVLIFSGTVFEALSIGALVPLVSYLTSSENFFGNIDLRYIILSVAAIFFIKSILLQYILSTQYKIIYDFEALLNNQLLSNYLSRNLIGYSNKDKNNYLRNLTTEVNLFIQLLIQIINLINESLIVIVLILLLLIFYPVFIISSLILSIFLLIYIRHTKKVIAKLGINRSLLSAKKIEYLNQAINNFRYIYIYESYKYFYEKFSSSNNQICQISTQQDIIQNTPRIWLEFFAIFLMLCYTFISANDNLLISLAIFAGSAFRIIPSLNRITWALQSIKYGLPAFENIYKDIRYKQKIIPLSVNKINNINAVNISYYTEDNKKIFNNFDIELKKGNIYLIVGESGVGKTTFADLMAGLISPSSGNILYNNENNIRIKVGYVPQKIELIDGTVIDNIVFGRGDTNICRIRYLLDLLMLGEVFSDQFDVDKKIICSGGVSLLSGGQAQRVLIARALYDYPDLIIFDESFNSLDIKTRLSVMKNLEVELGNLIALLITHDNNIIDQNKNIIQICNCNVTFKK